MDIDGKAAGVRIDQAKYGRGVYAVKRFMVEETIGRVHGSVICDPEHGSDYCIALADHLCLEPSAPFRYLNHSCDPNCVLSQFEVEDDDGEIVGLEIWVETLRAIEPGEQLTIDYAWPAESAIPCGCGSPACRGWIVDELQLSKVPAVARDHARRQRPLDCARSIPSPPDPIVPPDTLPLAGGYVFRNGHHWPESRTLRLSAC